MFQPQFATLALLLASAPAAFAQTATASISGSVTYRAQSARAQSAAPAAEANSDAILAALSAQAGIPFIPKKAEPAAVSTAATSAEADDPPLCLRAGVGLTVPVISGPQMTVEHGLIGCPTNTGGLPIVVLQDPTLQPPPTSRTGDYNVDVTLRYRLLQIRRIQLVASATEQGVGYSLGGPVSGNNLLLAMSLIF